MATLFPSAARQSQKEDPRELETQRGSEVEDESTVKTKIRIQPEEGNSFFIDKRGSVRKKRSRDKHGYPLVRPCEGQRNGCKNRVPSGRYICPSCWAEAKIFRRYLREVFGWAPIYDDGPGDPKLISNQRFRTFAEKVSPGRIPMRRAS